MTEGAPAEFALADEFAEPSFAHAAPKPPEITPPEPADQPASAADHPSPDSEPSAMTDEAPAELTLVDEFAEKPSEPADDAVAPAPLEATMTRPVEPPAAAVHYSPPDAGQSAVTDEAPAEFALVDEFAEDAGPTVEHPAPASPPEPDNQRAETPACKEPPPTPPTHPLRFTWRMNADRRFSFDPGEFTHLIGARATARFERLTSEIDEPFDLDPDGRFVDAVASRNTWSGVALNWPIDGGGQLSVELSGLPLLDRAANFAGFRGFGICRDLDGLTRLAASRDDSFGDAPPQKPPVVIVRPNSADIVASIARESVAANLPAKSGAAASDTPQSTASNAAEAPQQTDLENAVDTPKNVLPFRPISEPKSPALTQVENSAFNELARQLSARLESENGAAVATPATAEARETVVELPTPETAEQPDQQPEWLTPAEAPARGEARRDKALLDLLPVGVLIYRLDRLLYANRAFMDQLGFEGLHALEEAGGLDALYVEPGASGASSTSDNGRPVRISGTEMSLDHAPVDARLYTISWDGDSALALIFSNTGTPAAAVAAALPTPKPDARDAAAAPSATGHASAEELGAILDTTAEGILMFDAAGNINSCNRSAEALFGYDGPELVRRNLTELFAPESQPVVLDYLERIKGTASMPDHGRDVLGRVREGGIIPLSLTIGRTRPDGPNFFAVFRDLSQSRKSESELQQAERSADRVANAKADMLARISHEVRTPLNAIIGFAEVMIGERFGALGNERYVEYMKDIRSSGERVIAIINDLLDLSRIETGRLDLTFASQNLNDLVEQCVAVMQPQANRERIIIRTSLAQTLPPVIADARALRQIALNLIGNSIHLANAGGQVIVSTALSDFDEVVLRVRDTGQGLNDNEVAAAMEPFRTQPPSDRSSDSSGVSLSLTKALVEANRAHFHIKTASHSGTLIEVTFSHASAKA
jgi:PAS domain S-box-containing protein